VRRAEVATPVWNAHLEGLVLAEVELGVDDDRLGLPPTAVADVTGDDRHSEGALARLDGRGAGDLMATARR
jgi:CYTH domain-containing protein